jgi:hypothetical protein
MMSTVRLEGLGARMYVRGGMTGISGESIDSLAYYMMSIPIGTPAERGFLAAKMIEGYVSSNPIEDKGDPLVWHRLMGETKVLVQ